LSVVFSAACVLWGVLLFAIIYWQTKVFETRRILNFVAVEDSIVSQAPTDEIIRTVQALFTNEFHAMTIAALFDASGQLISGNLSHVPQALPADGRAREVELREQGPDDAPRMVIAAASRLADGKMLVLGRGESVVTSLAWIVAGALILGIISAIAPALVAGKWLSHKAERRLKAINQSIERITQGNVQERLPVLGIADDFDDLAKSVNRMLMENERLLAEVQGVSDNIAHDLRTPLARVRTFLERGRDTARSQDELTAVTERAIAGLDQAQAIITALLRIGEIEGGQRKAAFADVDLNEIVSEAAELYAPTAEAKEILFEARTEAASTVHGDKDLLMEVVANLLDNALKFTPPGGSVTISVINREKGPVIQVSDTGSGIQPEQREAVMKRFYRIDKSRNIAGSGLGLSIVLAIVTLHGYEIVVSDAEPGCRFEVLCFAPDRPVAKLVPQSEAWRHEPIDGETDRAERSMAS
jgi:signal transduction histidine kinase